MDKNSIFLSISKYKEKGVEKNEDIYHQVLEEQTGIRIFSSFLDIDGKRKLAEFDAIYREVWEEIISNEYKAKLDKVSLLNLTEVEKGNHVNSDIYAYGRSEGARISKLIESLDDEGKQEIKPYVELYGKTIGSSFNFGTSDSLDAKEKNNQAFRVIDQFFAKTFGMHICEIRHRLEMSEEEWVFTGKGL